MPIIVRCNELSPNCLAVDPMIGHARHRVALRSGQKTPTPSYVTAMTTFSERVPDENEDTHPLTTVGARRNLPVERYAAHFQPASSRR